MDTNMAPCPSDNAQSDLIQLAQLPDANRLSDASNDVDLDVSDYHNRRIIIIVMFGMIKMEAKPNPPFSVNDSQLSNLNMGSEDNPLISKEKKRMIKPNEFTQSILYDTLTPDASLSTEFQVLELPSIYDGTKVVNINGVNHKVLGTNKELIPLEVDSPDPKIFAKP